METMAWTNPPERYETLHARREALPVRTDCSGEWVETTVGEIRAANQECEDTQEALDRIAGGESRSELVGFSRIEVL